MENYDLKRQLTRSFASGGANYEEAQGFVSKADSRVKIGISLKEIREANYFLKISSHLHIFTSLCLYIFKIIALSTRLLPQKIKQIINQSFNLS